ncbi:MAG: hypothetical protein HY393_03870 [Candidatus Diapherotrites archaeon]|nr:hypothetical protein [Candidatus Diapherotrites archaeon]
MSRTVLTALRKHKTPEAFVKKFLLRALRAGRVSPIKNVPSGVHLPLKSPARTSGWIRFANIKNPGQVFYLNVEAFTILTPKGTTILPRLSIYPNMYGVHLSPKDWEQGQAHAHSHAMQSREILNIPSTHVNENWKPIEALSHVYTQTYPLPETLFNEVVRHAEASQRMKEFVYAAKFVTGHVQAPLFLTERMAPGQTPLDAYLQLTTRLRPFLQAIARAKSLNEITRHIQEQYKISPHAAHWMARGFYQDRQNPRIKKGIEKLLDAFEK